MVTVCRASGMVGGLHKLRSRRVISRRLYHIECAVSLLAYFHVDAPQMAAQPAKSCRTLRAGHSSNDPATGRRCLTIRETEDLATVINVSAKFSRIFPPLERLCPIAKSAPSRNFQFAMEAASSLLCALAYIRVGVWGMKRVMCHAVLVVELAALRRSQR